MKQKFAVISMCAVALGLTAQSAEASFHFMQIEQIIGGVNGDTTAQAIQLRMRSGFQTQVQNSRLFARDATGANPVLLATFPGPVANSAGGSRVLITSANFAAYTGSTLVTDRVMTALIPASYLPAGSLTFEDTGGLVYWRVSWGGASYTGITTGSTTNDVDGNFGKLTTALQSTSLQAIRFTGIASAQSVANQTDYALSASPAVFNNNAGTAFTVVACQTINLSPFALADATVGTPYSANITASGSLSPYTFAVTSGDVPAGLTFTSGGLLSGTPTAAGEVAIAVTATAANGCTGEQIYPFNIGCPITTISPPSLPSGPVNVPYSQNLSAVGGTGPYTYAVTFGALPAGLTLSSAGVLDGTPTTAETAEFDVTSTDANNCPGFKFYALTISGAGSPTGDLDGSGLADGLDIAHFVECVLTGSTTGGTCPPGDFDNSGGVNATDVAPFVAALLAA